MVKDKKNPNKTMGISRQEGDEMIDTLEVSMRKEGMRRRTDKRRLIVKILAH